MNAISRKRANRLLLGGDLTWVCAACGKTGTTRENIGDESCYLHAMLAWTASLCMDGKGRTTKATRVWIEVES